MKSQEEFERLLHELQLHQVELERQNAELRKAQAMLARTEQVAQLGSWEWDVATDTVTWSEELFRMFQCDPAKGAPSFVELANFYSPADYQRLQDAVQAAVLHFTPYELELCAIRTDGQKRVFLTRGHAVKGSNASAKTLFGSSQDITERKRAEQERVESAAIQKAMAENIAAFKQVQDALSESEQRFLRVLRASRDAILIIDGERFVDCNEATARMLGYCTQEEFLKTHPSELSPRTQPDGRMSFEKANEMMAIAFQRGFHQFEWIHRKASGEDFPVEVSLTSIVLKGKNVLHCVWRDITERKLAEEALLVAKNAAEAANIAKSQFLANMSHEIRTPMNGVLGMTQLLEMTHLTVDQQRYVAALKLSGENLMALLSDILDLSKIEAGKATLDPVEFSLQQCIHDVILLQKFVAQQKGLQLQMELSDAIPQRLVGDQFRIKQILLNLMGNAVKFTHAGSITVSANLLQQHSGSAVVAINVVDTGIGIAPAAIDKIFEAFVQEDGTTSRKFGGTGLGLTISRALTDLLGGTITVESRQGVGSHFTLTLPLALGPHYATSAHGTAPAITIPQWPGPPLLVLFVDDDESNILFGVALLKKLGFRVTTANCGKQCLDALEKAQFDLVLMDIQMPVMNGEEAMVIIRALEKETKNHLPIIALTAHSMRGDRERLLAAGFDGYVSKPLIIKDLVAEMKRTLIARKADS